jgi:hypothetical protein
MPPRSSAGWHAAGKNPILKRRAAQFHIERLAALVDELVASKVDVILR